ncbi:MAG: hypothetical protein CMB54_04760 [Euryarchaeota archaeon]|nr:hypothetical protein [Euryarchaeota archaeon]|tara:strand:- start:415 stop:834 length:420 start_codon:yes stop_codon:yes gene_type:complete
MSGSALSVLIFLISLLIGLSVPSQQPWIPSEDGVTLIAEERTEIPMPRGVRDLVTTIEDPSSFDVLYPGTNLSCKEVLTVHFHTNIHLNQDRNQLIAMDGSKWKVSGENALELTMSTVEEIAAMRYGSEEKTQFIEVIG